MLQCFHVSIGTNQKGTATVDPGELPTTSHNHQKPAGATLKQSQTVSMMSVCVCGCHVYIAIYMYKHDLYTYT